MTQLSLLEAIEERDSAIQSAVENADRKQAGWSDRAYKYLIEFSRTLPLFKGEDARRYAEEQGLPKPPDPRAWGAVLQRASRGKFIERVGFGVSTNRQAHSRPTAIWRPR
ncbi:hypothetical protein UFOVP32_49 [uncultured Caudovirales phage]|uniref:Uncharacterized protein n=1 Tax=uncultured Caudovirales phage TaxID=2100421 RepID=A0A6J5KTR8_9CAUD|nr:hypothetical protein UFOVP32_49 [uncultured Caudovirales phage]CAB4123619.1 hypothetical protein UFOVP50_27 [uncultured Caudovirales phage]